MNDVVIIGGGVIGLGIARELHKRGVRRITLLEKGACGKESSWAAGGMLGPQAEADEKSAFFEFCCASRNLYPAFAGELLAETGVDIEFDRAGTLYLAFTDEDVREVHKRFKWQRSVGLPVEHFSADDARRAEPMISPNVREALFFPGDWQVENRKLVAALKRYAKLNGIAVFENTAVEKLLFENGRVVGAQCNERSFTADMTVVATGAWTSDLKLGDVEMPAKIKPVRGQMIAFQTPGRLFRHVIYSPRGYIVPRRDGRILAGSTTEDVGFDRSVTDDAERSLQRMACEIAPSLARLEIADHWAGLRPFASDGLPVLGSVRGIDGLCLAAGHYRNGILLAPLTAKIVAEKLVDGVDSEYSAGFSADRFHLRGIGSGVSV